MSSDPEEQRSKKTLRILTIDNGGLQAISILSVLNEVCRKLSEKDGHSTTLEPHQLFDIIAGIGTGGWLAILLGRYRLRIDQCMSIYITIANAIDPTKQRRDGHSSSSGPTAINQKSLIKKIDNVVADHGIGQYLIDGKADKCLDPAPRQCYAFAVGVVKRASRDSEQQYRLFRTYLPTSEIEHEGPDPTRCKVSEACAATAAAKDFLGECYLDTDGITYWDDSFPLTHNVSDLALDEAHSIFGGASTLDFILNISPGVVSPADVEKLKRTATMHSSIASVTREWSARRFFSFNRPSDPARSDLDQQIRAATDPAGNNWRQDQVRSDTSSSASSNTSSVASEKERGHQEAIKRRLRLDPRTADRGDIYFRLELTARSDKPYLDDVSMPDHAMQLAQEYLRSEDTVKILDQITNDWRKTIAERGLTATPQTSCPDFNALPSIMAN